MGAACRRRCADLTPDGVPANDAMVEWHTRAGQVQSENDVHAAGTECRRLLAGHGLSQRSALSRHVLTKIDREQEAGTMVRWLLRRAIRSFERTWNYDASYMKAIVDLSPRAAVKFARATSLG